MSCVCMRVGVWAWVCVCVCVCVCLCSCIQLYVCVQSYQTVCYQVIKATSIDKYSHIMT